MITGSMEDTFIVDNHDDVKLLGAEVMKDRREAARRTTKKSGTEYKDPDYTEEELKRFALLTISERIKFCNEKKEKKEKLGENEDIDKCVCEAVSRWIRLFKDNPMQGSKELGKLRIAAVEKMFEEMKKDGKIKCRG